MATAKKKSASASSAKTNESKSIKKTATKVATKSTVNTKKVATKESIKTKQPATKPVKAAAVLSKSSKKDNPKPPVATQTKAPVKDDVLPKKDKDTDDDVELHDNAVTAFDLDDDVVPAEDGDEDDGFLETKKKEISRAGYDKLVEELKDLEEVQIPSVNARIKEAREFGDLSENAEYQSALNEKQMLETRIGELKETIALSVVVDSAKNSDTVQYGSTVSFEFLDTGETATVVIIGSAEITYEEQVRHISFDSPIGTALEGKKVGDTCKVRAEKGRFDIKILSIK